MKLVATRTWISLIAALFIHSAAFVQASLAAEWTDYRNERFGFSLQYPADVFAVERATETGDGQVFAARDGDARLLVGALINEPGDSPASYLDYLARHSYSQYQIGYRRLARSWLVLSGEGNGRVFYEKAMFSCAGRLISSFAMLYPKEQSHVFDRIVERIEKTFRPARDCERAGLPSIRSDPPPARSRHPKQVGAQRSALADRIARARGNNVIVVLRRTTPPYDQKVVRGYASRP